MTLVGGDPLVVYAPDRIGTRWNVVDRAHPNGHRGCDFRLPAAGGSWIPAYERCVVVSTPFSPILGFCTVVRYADGRFGYWAHLRRGTRPNVGDVLNPGDKVGLAAAGPKPRAPLSEAQADADYPGTAWDGAHIHTGVGPLLSSVFSGVTYDPLPRIQNALYALAGSGDYTPVSAGSTGTEITMTYEEFRDFLRRAFKYDVREGETTGATFWERFAALAVAMRRADPSDDNADGKGGWLPFRNAMWRFLKYHSRADGPDGKARTVFEQLDAIESAVKANGAVTFSLSDADLAKLAAQIAPAGGLTAAEVEAAVGRALARVFVNAQQKA